VAHFHSTGSAGGIFVQRPFKSCPAQNGAKASATSAQLEKRSAGTCAVIFAKTAASAAETPAQCSTMSPSGCCAMRLSLFSSDDSFSRSTRGDSPASRCQSVAPRLKTSTRRSAVLGDSTCSGAA